MKRRRKNLSTTEWTLMNICWEKGKVSARIIFEESQKDKKRAYQTIKTLLDKLVDKEYLKRERFGPIWLYEPTITREQTVSNAIDSFADTVLNNTLTPLFSHFIKKEKMSEEEIEVLEKLIKKHKEE